jgi:hypothetical protein
LVLAGTFAFLVPLLLLRPAGPGNSFDVLGLIPLSSGSVLLLWGVRDFYIAGEGTWIRLGIYPELIEPTHPEQNGRHERMHRTLKAEATRPFGPLKLGRMNERILRIEDHKGRTVRKTVSPMSPD